MPNVKYQKFLVPMAGIGPATSPLPRECSTTEPHGRYPEPHADNRRVREPCCTATIPYHYNLVSPQFFGRTRCARYCNETGTNCSGAGEGNRTLVVSLEGFCSTIELHPRNLPPRQPHPNTCPAKTTLLLLSHQNSGGGGRIRTIVLVRGQIYSLLPLTTRPPLQ